MHSLSAKTSHANIIADNREKRVYMRFVSAQFVRAIIFLYRGCTSFLSTLLYPFFTSIFYTASLCTYKFIWCGSSSIMYLFLSSFFFLLLRFFFLFPKRRYHDCVYERGRKCRNISKSFPEYFLIDAITELILLSFFRLYLALFLSFVPLFSLPPIYPMFHVIFDKFEIE